MHHDPILPTLSIFFIIFARDLFLLNVIGKDIKSSVISLRNNHFMMKVCTLFFYILYFSYTGITGVTRTRDGWFVSFK